MKFGIAFANVGPFGQAEHAAFLGQRCDEVGVESLWTVEHVVVPQGYEAQYPYSKDGRMPGAEDSPIPDPIVWLSFMAGVTERVRLGTGILILPQRHPVYVAKAFASLDQLSGGRALLGVGIGWMKDEFEVLGIPFAERAPRTEESCQALRSLWSPGATPFDGKFYNWGPVESNPKPVQQPGVPIIVGGHVPGAARRAARVGDGFWPNVTPDQLPGLLDTLADECGKSGRDPGEIEITCGLGKPSLDFVKQMEDLGVSRLMMPPPAFDPDGLRAGLEKIGNELIAKA
jgi:probable F420-dependent oxidoreductase